MVLLEQRYFSDLWGVEEKSFLWWCLGGWEFQVVFGGHVISAFTTLKARSPSATKSQ